MERTYEKIPSWENRANKCSECVDLNELNSGKQFRKTGRFENNLTRKTRENYDPAKDGCTFYLHLIYLAFMTRHENSTQVLKDRQRTLTELRA